MIKVFTLNKNGKIELDKKELKELLDDAYWEGYRNRVRSYTYTSPSWSPYTWSTSGSSTCTTLTNNAGVTTANNTILDAAAQSVTNSTTVKISD